MAGLRRKNTLKRELQPLTRVDFEKLLENYRHLRRVEGILRRWSYEGETVLPDDPAPYYRVSVRCGFASSEDFGKALAKWRKAIREVYGKFSLQRCQDAEKKTGSGKAVGSTRLRRVQFGVPPNCLGARAIVGIG